MDTKKIALHRKNENGEMEDIQLASTSIDSIITDEIDEIDNKINELKSNTNQNICQISDLQHDIKLLGKDMIAYLKGT